jgi:phosphoribosylformylglycinamidine synthase
MLWQIDIFPAAHEVDRAAERIRSEASDLGLSGDLTLAAGRGYLIEADADRAQILRVARDLLADDLVERTVVGVVGEPLLANPPNGLDQSVHVLLKPGVMDPVAQSAAAAIADFGIGLQGVRTYRKYWFGQLDEPHLVQLAAKLLANDAIEQVVLGPLAMDHLEIGGTYAFELVTVPLRSLADQELIALSRQGQLSLSLAEMKTIQEHFRQLQREPTDIELETIAQSWSEHCSHKTLKGRIAYRDEHGSRQFDNLLKETVFEATQNVRRQLGTDDWCVSVFEDNAGVVTFDQQNHVVFKVETHNHPSALEPYGGANTGLGGVIRDPLGTGLGAKPICSTDVFCFAPPETPADQLPKGVLHPRRVMKGVVAGVRDYGNRMGIPTVNGAIYFDDRYLGNPLVFCGNVGLLPCDRTEKRALPGDHIVAIGGRTGRDGIHGATFSSIELTSESEKTSGGAVQIGNAITEKMVLDVVLTARDRGLFNAITDCGAGGFSSAVGEMGEKIGAEVWLERAPLKYDGLTYTEIWISEAQERMVLAVPPENWEAFAALCASEGVEATIIGKFVPTKRLKLMFAGHPVGDLAMQFLHDGRPAIVREASYQPIPSQAFDVSGARRDDYAPTLLAILGSLNVCSKEWVIRQYDHEVQGGSVVKPLTGAHNDGPSDAAVVRPCPSSQRGIVVSCGMNPYFGDLDTYWMAASAIDEAIRNCVAVGADPDRIAILDNFCWGNTDRPEVLGSLVRAALACRDVAIAWRTPFISGKDSLNNEFRAVAADGSSRQVAIPPTLLISALGQIANVERAVTMDLKRAGNLLYLVGETKAELGGSHFGLVEQVAGGAVPQVDLQAARARFTAMHRAIDQGLVRSCHDLSEGGLAVAAAEMAFAGNLGAEVDLTHVPLLRDAGDFSLSPADWDTWIPLFSESNSRFLCEIEPNQAAEFEQIFPARSCAKIGTVLEAKELRVLAGEPRRVILQATLNSLKEAWQAPLRW